ncbi:hypothetical protein LNTAR_18740 [Lentisphaera araneosa HTCC2155]|jgi:hypothetical protein|uniref:VOC domain-containing protein n=1 Tax=Lentisphaera araneosa HTCC2155 TaxID=313628 RepID=A6DNQ4_9BACT|nr:hypothetical protein [Lentisphaera araneosa]EDM26713.1 hypothetical protein LNTAR_18740 [Lentisphaera araneosa HTCC2155]
MKPDLSLDKFHILSQSKELNESTQFYLALGLVQVNDKIFSDGSACIELRDHCQNIPSIYIEAHNDQDVFNHYQDLGIIFDCSSTENGDTELFFTDPNGLSIFLGEKTARHELPNQSSCTILELSQSTKHYVDSINFWVQLGATCDAMRSDYPRTLLRNKPLLLGLHDNSKYKGQGLIISIKKEAIQKLKKLGTPLMKNSNGSFLCFSPDGLQFTLSLA